MKTFFATFGTGHAYSPCFVEIIAESERAAEVHMMREHGARWGAVYPEPGFLDMAARHRLQRMVTVRQRDGYPAETPFFDVERNA